MRLTLRSPVIQSQRREQLTEVNASTYAFTSCKALAFTAAASAGRTNSMGLPTVESVETYKAY